MRLYIVFGDEPVDALNQTIRSFDRIGAVSVLFYLVRRVVVYRVCRQQPRVEE